MKNHLFVQKYALMTKIHSELFNKSSHIHIFFIIIQEIFSHQGQPRTIPISWNLEYPCGTTMCHLLHITSLMSKKLNIMLVSIVSNINNKLINIGKLLKRTEMGWSYIEKTEIDSNKDRN